MLFWGRKTGYFMLFHYFNSMCSSISFPLFLSSAKFSYIIYVVFWLFSPCPILCPQLIHDYSPLGKFWQRYNKVQLDRLCLKREKMLMLQENERLRIYLKQYLDEVSVPDESFQQKKLLVVSSPTLQATAATERRDQKRYVVQEAANIVQKQL